MLTCQANIQLFNSYLDVIQIWTDLLSKKGYVFIQILLQNDIYFKQNPIIPWG